MKLKQKSYEILAVYLTKTTKSITFLRCLMIFLKHQVFKRNSMGQERLLDTALWNIEAVLINISQLFENFAHLKSRSVKHYLLIIMYVYLFTTIKNNLKLHYKFHCSKFKFNRKIAIWPFNFDYFKIYIFILC